MPIGRALALLMVLMADSGWVAMMMVVVEGVRILVCGAGPHNRVSTDSAHRGSCRSESPARDHQQCNEKGDRSAVHWLIKISTTMTQARRFPGSQQTIGSVSEQLVVTPRAEGLIQPRSFSGLLGGLTAPLRAISPIQGRSRKNIGTHNCPQRSGMVGSSLRCQAPAELPFLRSRLGLK
jgi:hypothetical protein